MKKAIFKGFAVAALALAVLFTGCKNEPSNIETIRTDAVEITVKAYPGYNYITWTKPENFQNATVTIMRDDGTTLTSSGNKVIDYDIKDGVTYKYTAYVAAPNAGSVEYQYKFNATSGASLNDVSTDVKGVLYAGNSSSASCKAINPVCIKDGKLMTALELCEYEDGCDEDYIINADNIVVEYDAYNNRYDVAFPTKEYLTYEPKLYKGNVIDVFGLTASTTAESSSGTKATNGTNTALPYIGTGSAVEKFYTNDTAVRYNGVATSAGEYTVVVKVSAKNKSYSDSIVTAAKKVVIDALDVDVPTGTPKAGYIDEGNKVRLIWTPAVKSDKTTKWAAESYKVYVKDAYGVYTEIAPAKVAKVDEDGETVEDEDGNPIMTSTLAINTDKLQKGEPVYYIDYAVPNNLITYTFYVVLSDNGKFENGTKVAYVNAYAEAGYATDVDSSSKAVFANIDNNEVVDDAVLTLNIAANNGASAATRATVTAKYKTISLAANGSSYAGFDFDTDSTVGDSFSYSDSDIATLWLDTDFTDATITPNTDYTRFDAIVKDQPIDSFVVFLYKVSQPNKKDRYGYIITKGTTGNVVVSSLSTYNFSIASELDISDARTLEDATKDPSLTITLTPAKQDNFSAYTYELSYAKLSTAASTQTKNADYDNIASWTPVTLSAIAWDKDATPAKFLSKTEKVPLKVTTPVYTYDADGKAKVASYRDEYVFKIVVTNKNAKGTDKGSKTYYTTVTEYTKAVTE